MGDYAKLIVRAPRKTSNKQRQYFTNIVHSSAFKSKAIQLIERLIDALDPKYLALIDHATVEAGARMYVHLNKSVVAPISANKSAG